MKTSMSPGDPALFAIRFSPDSVPSGPRRPSDHSGPVAWGLADASRHPTLFLGVPRQGRIPGPGPAVCLRKIRSGSRSCRFLFRQEIADGRTSVRRDNFNYSYVLFIKCQFDDQASGMKKVRPPWASGPFLPLFPGLYSSGKEEEADPPGLLAFGPKIRAGSLSFTQNGALSSLAKPPLPFFMGSGGRGAPAGEGDSPWAASCRRGRDGSSFLSLRVWGRRPD